jgi:hypothetical protein
MKNLFKNVWNTVRTISLAFWFMALMLFISGLGLCGIFPITLGGLIFNAAAAMAFGILFLREGLVGIFNQLKELNDKLKEDEAGKV